MNKNIQNLYNKLKYSINDNYTKKFYEEDNSKVLITSIHRDFNTLTERINITGKHNGLEFDLPPIIRKIRR